MLRGWLAALALGGCWTSSSAPPSAPPPNPAPVVSPVPKQKTCDKDPNILERAAPAIDCARNAMQRRAFSAADRLASEVLIRFPYSKMALAAEEIQADVLFARRRYADAARAYDRFLRYHPTSDRAADIRSKLAGAKARSAP